NRDFGVLWRKWCGDAGWRAGRAVLEQWDGRTTNRSDLRDKVIFSQRSVSSGGQTIVSTNLNLVMRGTEHGRPNQRTTSNIGREKNQGSGRAARMGALANPASGNGPGIREFPP